MFSSGAAPQHSRSCRRATGSAGHVVVTCPPDECDAAEASTKSRHHGGSGSRTGCLLRLPSAVHRMVQQHPPASGDIGPVLTPRALAAGLLVGSVLCFSNTFFGLQTGWVTMGSLQSAILGYGLFQGLWAAGLLSRHLSVGENIILQTTAVATATMPLAAGLVGIIPALGLLSPEQNPPSGPVVLSTLQLLGWCTALAFFGVFCAVPLRHQTIIKEQLTFPSGTATASVIRTLHGLPPAPTADEQEQQQQGEQEAAARMSSAGASGQAEATAAASKQRWSDGQLYGQQADLEAPGGGGTQHQRQPGSSSADGQQTGSGPSQADLQVAVLEEAHTERSSLLGEASRGYNGSSDGAAGGVVASSWQLQQQRQQQWKRALHVLMWCFAASGVYSLAAAWVKPLKVWPIFDWVHLPAATAWGWVFQPSAGYIGQGAIMGPKTSLSMLGGAITGWAILGPMAKAKGWAPGPITDAETGAAGWLMWLGLALLLGDCFSELALLVASTLLEKARQHGWLLLLAPPQGARRAQQQLSGPGAAWGREPAPAAQGRHSGSPRLCPRNGSFTAAPGASLLEMSSSTSSSSRSLDGAAAMGAAEDAAVASSGPAALASAKQAAPPPQLAGPGKADADDTASDPWGWMLSVRCWGPGLLLSTAVAIAILAPMMSMPWYEPLVAVIFSLLVALLAVRALGQTDLNPVSGVGKISQVVFAMVSGKVLPNLVAGAIAEAAAQQAGDLMQDFKAAHLLGVPPSSQLVAMLLGSAASVPISVAAFKLYTTAWQVPSPELPAPTARVWLDMAALVNGGSLPEHVASYCAGAAAIAALLPVMQLLLKRCQRQQRRLQEPRPDRRGGGGVLRQAGARLWQTWRARSGVDWALALLPSGVGFAVGMYLSPRWTLPRVLGSMAEQAWLLVSPGTHTAFMVVAASGLVLGEGCASVVTAVIQAAMKGAGAGKHAG